MDTRAQFDKPSQTQFDKPSQTQFDKPSQTQPRILGIISGIKIGITLSAIIIFLWYVFAMFYYRYSPERITGMVIRRYEQVNKSKLSPKTGITVARIDVQGGLVSADIAVIDNQGRVLKTETVQYELNAGSCDDSLDETNCIPV